MSDYSNWEKWLSNIYTDLLNMVSKMNTAITQKDIISLRKDYIHRCDEWLNLCDVMRKRIEYSKARAMQQIDIVVKD